MRFVAIHLIIFNNRKHLYYCPLRLYWVYQNCFGCRGLLKILYIPQATYHPLEMWGGAGVEERDAASGKEFRPLQVCCSLLLCLCYVFSDNGFGQSRSPLAKVSVQGDPPFLRLFRHILTLEGNDCRVEGCGQVSNSNSAG